MAEELSKLVPDQKVLITWNSGEIRVGYVEIINHNGLFVNDIEGTRHQFKENGDGSREEDGKKMILCPKEIDQTPREFKERRIKRCLGQRGLKLPDDVLQAIFDLIPESHV